MTARRGLHPPERVAEYVGRGWWTGETLDGLFRDTVAERGDAPAIADPANRADLLGSPPRRLTWSELDGEVTALAVWLLDLGLRRGDVLGVQLPNTVELAEAYLAAWSIGVVVSPLPMQFREHEVGEAARQAAFRAFLTVPDLAGRSPAAEVHALRDRLPGRRPGLADGGRPGHRGGDHRCRPRWSAAGTTGSVST